MFKKLLNKINDRIDKFESNTKANYEIGLEKIYNEHKQIYDKVRYLPDFEKRNKTIESQQRTIEALTNALCDKYNHGLFIYSEDGDVPMVIRNGKELTNDMTSQFSICWCPGEAPNIQIEQIAATHHNDGE